MILPFPLAGGKARQESVEKQTRLLFQNDLGVTCRVGL